MKLATFTDRAATRMTRYKTRNGNQCATGSGTVPSKTTTVRSGALLTCVLVLAGALGITPALATDARANAAGKDALAQAAAAASQKGTADVTWTTTAGTVTVGISFVEDGVVTGEMVAFEGVTLNSGGAEMIAIRGGEMFENMPVEAPTMEAGLSGSSGADLITATGGADLITAMVEAGVKVKVS